MFSTRYSLPLGPNALAREVEARRLAGLPLLDLTLSNPTRAGLEYPAAELLGALASPRSLRYEPVPAGLPAAREAVAAWYARRGVAVPVDRLVLTASTSEAYTFLFKLLADPGDEVLVPVPSYPLFELLAKSESLSVRHYPLVYHRRWSIDLEALEAAAGPRTRAIVLVSPNNPTGSFVKRQELDAILELAARRGLAIIADEVFQDYPAGEDASRVDTVAAEDRALVFAMGGLSKAAGLPQLKLGWIAANGPAVLLRDALERLELICDTFLSVATPVQWALPRLLELAPLVRDRIQDRLARNRLELAAALAGRPECEALHCEGGWSAILRVPRTLSEEQHVVELAREEGVLVHPGYFFDFPEEAFLVVSLLPEPETFRRGLALVLQRFA